ncbi:winged helix-turn-helix domain-containing protein [Bradyrhizobium sp. 38]|uniref:winged helix-turn-helix domain-containing tetratricopeptide repeat protein n=1 Tax=unclassified Bradyrhizobium TaxID=2631580 RepID=UPI001FFB66C8|nr:MULTISPECIES: winged helix-turn-helix domain-containing protein [unclassified Bradyrhizobium]MCK1334663.1 winged helix-turn-helix domain-containing protein [Bradyrhizobium sp. 38]MCK1777913.1 winged helix-turn-helix domain-containing protein [Bradyrhizobium sp. 132]
MSVDRYKIGEFTLDVSQGCLRRGGVEIALRPKSFALLQHLITHAGRLVTKDELLSNIWPNVIVTEDSLTRCVSEARAALGDTDQSVIKTVSKRGYIFAKPVTQGDDDTVVQLAADVTPVPGTLFKRRARTVQLMVLGFVLMEASVWYAAFRVLPTTEHPRLSLIVLPFANLSADPAQDYLGDIITSELTTALSRLRGATIIAAGSALTLRSKPADIKQVGMDLDVRYVLEGSVLRSDTSVRINARLIDTQTMKTLWSDRFDVDRVDILRTQDEIVTRLASTLHGEMVQADIGRATAAHAANLDAEDLAMRCEASTYRVGLPGMPGYEWCERALKIDPDNVRALVQLAMFYSMRVSRVQSPDAAADLEKANVLVRRALEIDPGYYAAHCAKATVLEGQHHVSDGLAEAERCLALNPTYAGAYRALALLHFFLARPDKMLEYAERGIRLSPRDPQTSTFLLIKGWAHMMLGQDEEGLIWFRRAAAASPKMSTVIAGLTSELALTGRDAEARATLAQYLAMEDTRTRTIAQWDYLPDDNPEFMKFHLRFKSGLRKAGMSEQ